MTNVFAVTHGDHMASNQADMVHSKTMQIYLNHKYIPKCKYQWLHPRGTSSTFCLTMQHVCDWQQFYNNSKEATGLRTIDSCVRFQPKKYASSMGFTHNNPMWNYQSLHNYVAILREPRQRVMSMFLRGVINDDVGNNIIFPPISDEKQNENSSEKIYDNDMCLENYIKYISLPSNINCYVRMFNGRLCTYVPPPESDDSSTSNNLNATYESQLHNTMDVESDSMTRHALYVMEHMYFIGIFELYSDSIKLFLNMTLLHDDTDGVHDKQNDLGISVGSNESESSAPMQSIQGIHNAITSNAYSKLNQNKYIYAGIEGYKYGSMKHLQQLNTLDQFEAYMHSFPSMNRSKKTKRKYRLSMSMSDASLTDIQLYHKYVAPHSYEMEITKSTRQTDCKTFLQDSKNKKVIEQALVERNIPLDYDKNDQYIYKNAWKRFKADMLFYNS